MSGERLRAQVTVLLAEEVLAAVQAQAWREARSVGNLVRVLVAEGLARRGGGPNPVPARANVEAKGTRAGARAQ